MPPPIMIPQLLQGGPQPNTLGWRDAFSQLMGWLGQGYQAVEGAPARGLSFLSGIPQLQEQAKEGTNPSIEEMIRTILQTEDMNREPPMAGPWGVPSDTARTVAGRGAELIGATALSPSLYAAGGAVGALPKLGKAGQALATAAGTAFTGGAAGHATASTIDLVSTLQREGFSDDAARLIADIGVSGGFAAVMGKGLFSQLKAADAARLRNRLQVAPPEAWPKEWGEMRAPAGGTLQGPPSPPPPTPPTPSLPRRAGQAILNMIRPDPTGRTLSMGGPGSGSKKPPIDLIRKPAQGPDKGPEWMQSEGRTSEHGGRKTKWGRRPKGMVRALEGERAFPTAMGQARNIIEETQAIMGQNSMVLTKAINHLYRQLRLPVGDQSWPSAEPGPPGKLPPQRVIVSDLAKQIRAELESLGLEEAFSALPRRQRTPEALNLLINKARAASGAPAQVPELPPAPEPAASQTTQEKLIAMVEEKYNIPVEDRLLPKAAPPAVAEGAEVVGASARARVGKPRSTATEPRGPLPAERIDSKIEGRLRNAEDEISILERMGEGKDFARLQTLRKEAADLRTQLKAGAGIDAAVGKLRKVREGRPLTQEEVKIKADNVIRNAENQLAIQREFATRPEDVARLKNLRRQTAQLRAQTERGEVDESFILEVANLVRTCRTTLDISGHRQAAPLIPGHPFALARSEGRAFRGAFSSKQQAGVYGRMAQKTIDTPQGKVNVSELGDRVEPPLFRSRGDPMVEEELAGAAMLDKGLRAMKLKPLAYLVRASQRHFETLLDSMRLEVFTPLARRLYKKGYTPEEHPEAFGQIAQYANRGSGRGDPVEIANIIIGRRLKAGEISPSAAKNLRKVLAVTLWSPKLVAARWQHMGMLLTRAPKALRGEGMKDARRIIRREMNKDALVGLATGLAIMEAAREAGKELGVEVFYDPNEPDWGKIKIGNTRYDIWGGYVQNARTVFRTLRDGLKVASREEYFGDVKSTGRPEGGDPTRHGKSYLQYKESPTFSYFHSFFTGQDPFGRAFDPWGTAARQFTPLAGESGYEVFNDPALQNLTETERLLLGLPDIIGVSTGTYAPREQEGRFNFSRRRRR